MAELSHRYIFLVDDEPIQNEMLKDYLNERFLYNIETYENGESALQNMNLNPEIIVLDYHLSANDSSVKNGVEVLKSIKSQYPNCQVIMLSGQDKLDVAVDSMKYGAYDYVVKGETAFNKVENTINRISELHKYKVINTAQKRTITLLAIVVTLIVLFSIYLYFFTDAYNH